MAVELITGYAGTAHVGSDDARSAIAGIVGTGSYYSSYTTPVVSMTNANTLHITECWLYLGGGFFHVEDADATIENGEGVLKRCDLLCVEYDKDSRTSVESAKLVVVKGTAGSTATVPTVTSGDIIAGCSVAQFPIAKVTLDGLTPTAALMVGKAPTTAALQDSVSWTQSGNFIYRKSPDGILEMVYRKAVTADVTNPWGSIFYADWAMGESFPVSFASVPVCTAEKTEGSLLWLSINGVSTTTVNGFICSSKSGTETIVVNIHLLGRWK
jgi:hypothetical protein